MTSLSQPLQAVVALFEGPLSGVRFADVDAAGLSRLAAELASVSAEVEQHEAKLVELRQGLAQRQEALVALSQRALAYARVYAEDDDELLAKLNDIALPRVAKARKPSAAKPAATSSATEEASALESSRALEEQAEAAAAEVDKEAPAKTKPAYERPKIKRRLGRAAPQGDSV
jgi:hypothetical protein